MIEKFFIEPSRRLNPDRRLDMPYVVKRIADGKIVARGYDRDDAEGKAHALNTKANKPEVTRETVTAAVFAYYIEHGKACTRRELAEHSGIPYNTISKLYQEPGFWREIDLTHVTITIESRDYPGFVSRTRRVEAFLPSRNYMRKRFIEVSAS